MDSHNLVAVYNSRHDAERALDELLRFGIPAEDVRLSAAGAEFSDAGSTGMPADDLPRERHGSFWDWLFGSEVSERDRTWYTANLREGRTALSVLARDYTQHEQVEDILERFDPIDIDDEPTKPPLMAQPGVAGPGIGAPSSVERGAGGSSATRAGATERIKEGEERSSR